MKIEEMMRPYSAVETKLEGVKFAYDELSELIHNKKSAFVLSRISDVMAKMQLAS